MLAAVALQADATNHLCHHALAAALFFAEIFQPSAPPLSERSLSTPWTDSRLPVLVFCSRIPVSGNWDVPWWTGHVS